MSTSFAHFLATCQTRINALLDTCLPAPTEPGAELKQAMRYSALDGGKRVRAALVYGAAQAVSGHAFFAAGDSAACAVELIHAYSLVHDDLPAMDDDALRRGKPTCHIAFSEATAILAGDALQTLAFECLAQDDTCPPVLRCQLICTLAHAAGQGGMVAGQALDLAAERQQITVAQLETLHQHKTGALIAASVHMGGLIAGASPAQLSALEQYSHAVGLAFQVKDDILDIEGTTEALGKQQGADVALQKSTYPSLLGLDQAKAYADALHQQAQTSLAVFGENGAVLSQLAHFIVNRSN